MKTKIALLHYAYPPDIGGVEFLLREHAHILSSRGCDVKILVGSGKEVNKNIELIEIPEFQSLKNYNFMLQQQIDIKNYGDDFYAQAKVIEAKLVEYLSDRDVIIVHNMLTLSRNLPFIYALRRYMETNSGKKVFVWVHDHKYIEGDIIETGGDVFETKLLTEILPGAYYICISNFLKNQLLKLINIGEGKCKVIHNGVNINNFLKSDEQLWNIFIHMNLLEKFPLVVSPVNILERKNLEYSIEIIYNLKKTYPNIFYIITGKSSLHRDTSKYEDFLKDLSIKFNLEDNILFLSDIYKGDLDMSNLYRLGDFVFYFSKSENFGMPLLESTLYKTPIFVSNLEVFHEVGGELLNYIDIKTNSPSDASLVVNKFIEDNKNIRFRFDLRTKYNLEKILEKNLLPLL